ncbi:thioredoxin family protein [Streptococcus didelphis]|uniref:Thioredoxin family protein n=1 Tax=Streptococcus didelphis TaxID=102886 RepID=A0ABY9LGC9_9STRE|nr:thioredoxin family protein [Streptococcus didelphis]WMB27904.1 thioredoxin family protein [Streptococcus didelphis]WMB29625.1 thioredoxin family protein [Streptococcus didelphis]
MEFKEAVSHFKEVTSEQLTAYIEKEDELVAFFGRASCPYCRLFAPKLVHVSQDKNLKVYFIDTDNVSDSHNIQKLRQAYNIRTVPGLLVKKADKLKEVCDSSLSEDEILDLIQS